MRDDHREEADQRDHDQLGEDPEAPPEHQQHADHRDRHRLRADRQRVHGAAQQREQVDRDREREAADERQREPEHDLLGGRPRSCATRRRRCSTAPPPPRAGPAAGLLARPRSPRTAPTRRAARPRAGPEPPAAPGPRAASRVRVGRSSALAHPQSAAARARAARSPRGRCATRGRGELDLELRDHASGPRREHDHAVGQQHRLLDVVGDEHDRARLARQRCAPSHSCISARVIASSAPNGSSRHSSGLPDSSVRRNATRWRMPPESSCGRACWKPSRPSSANSAFARRAGLGARAAGDAQRERRVVERAQPRQQQVALGHQHRGRALDRARVGRAAARRSAPAACSCRSRSGRPPPAARRGAARSETSASACTRRRGAGWAGAVGEAHPLQGDRAAVRSRPDARTVCGIAVRWPLRSLRGHYPTGSKGRRRGIAGGWDPVDVISAGLPASPPGVCSVAG